MWMHRARGAARLSRIVTHDDDRLPSLVVQAALARAKAIAKAKQRRAHSPNSHPVAPSLPFLLSPSDSVPSPVATTTTVLTMPAIAECTLEAKDETGESGNGSQSGATSTGEVFADDDNDIDMEFFKLTRSEFLEYATCHHTESLVHFLPHLACARPRVFTDWSELATRGMLQLPVKTFRYFLESPDASSIMALEVLLVLALFCTGDQDEKLLFCFRVFGKCGWYSVVRHAWLTHPFERNASDLDDSDSMEEVLRFRDSRCNGNSQGFFDVTLVNRTK